MQVIATLLVGARPEPYLAAMLHSLRGAVDRLIVNDNSNQSASLNRRVIEASQLFRDGLVDIIEAPFQGFASARNLCLDGARRYLRGAAAWILMVDADEVHGDGFRRFTRGVLPTIPAAVGGVDAYVVQFMQTPAYFIALDRRHNLLYRLNDDVHYERDVHEQLMGVRGPVICLPYVYFHYGYVRPNQQILEKWLLYHGLGDTTYEAFNFPKQAAADMFVDQAPKCMPYTWHQPRALKDSGAEGPPADQTAEFREVVDAYLAEPKPRLRAMARRLNYRLRLVLRLVQAMWWVRRPLPWLALAWMVVNL